MRELHNLSERAWRLVKTFNPGISERVLATLSGNIRRGELACCFKSATAAVTIANVCQIVQN